MNAKKATAPKVPIPSNPSKKSGKKVSKKDLLGPYLSRVTEQFINPGGGDGVDLVVSPASFPQQVCVRHLHKEIDITSVEQPGGFRVVMKPDLQNPGFVTSPVVLFLPASGPGPIDGSGQLLGTSDGGDVNEGFAKFTDNTLVNVLSEVVPILDSAAVTYFGFNFNSVGIPVVSFDIVKRSLSPANLNVWTKIAGGAWVLVVTLPLTQARGVSFSGQLLANADAIAFSIFGNTDQFSSKFSIGLSSAQIVSASIHSYAPAFDTFGIDNDITTFRVISLEILLQNTSPDIANGGNINAGRVPYDFVPFGPNTIDNLSSLPTNRRYQGKASLGADVTWMPSQYDEFEPDYTSSKVLALASAEYLFAEVDGWGGGALTSSFKIHFDWIVEFYTPNQIFEKILTPPRTSDFDRLFHVLLMMPAATCNPEHENSFRKFVEKAGQAAKKGLEFYKDHSETIDSVLGALARML